MTSRYFAKGDIFKQIEVNGIGIIDKSTNEMTNITFSNKALEINNDIVTKSYISFHPNSEPKNNSYATIWVNNKNEINIKKPNKDSLNLYDIITPQGFSQTIDQTHFNDSNLGNFGKGSIQFKKNETEFGASSELQYDYGNDILLASNIAPLENKISFKVLKDGVYNDVFHFGNAENKYDTNFQCTFTNTTVDINKSKIRNCGYIGFSGNRNAYANDVSNNEEQGSIYVTGNDIQNKQFPFNNPGNVIVQVKADRNVIFSTKSSDTNKYKETFVIKNKKISINPNKGNDQTFIEFDAETETRRMNIHGQEGNDGIWSLVHTPENNLEFQYFENTTNLNNNNITQTLTLRKETKNNATNYLNRNLCFLEESPLFRTVLNNNSIIFIHNLNNKYYLSNNSNLEIINTNDNYDDTYEVNSNHYNFYIDDYSNIKFFVPNSRDFTSVINMIYVDSHWIPNSNSFSFIGVKRFISLDSQPNIILYTQISESDFIYTGYSNSYSGYLASSTGVYHKNTDNDLMNLENALPKVIKTNNEKDPSIVGVIGRIEKDENFTSRPYYWGAFGTTLFSQNFKKTIIASSGFVGMWVVTNDGSSDNIEYNVGDLLTSHSCGAAILQKDGGSNDTIVKNYTIGKIAIVGSLDNETVEPTENPIVINNILLTFMGVHLLL